MAAAATTSPEYSLLVLAHSVPSNSIQFQFYLINIVCEMILFDIMIAQSVYFSGRLAGWLASGKTRLANSLGRA